MVKIKKNEVIANLANLSLTELENMDWLDLIEQVSCGTDDKLNLILLAIKADENFYSNINTVKEQVKSIIHQHFDADIEITNVGCTSNGLALKSCSVGLVITRKLLLDSKTALDRIDKDFLNELQNYLKRSPENFQEVEIIESTNPTIQFKSLGLQFELKLSSNVMYHHNLLVHKFVRSDDKIKNLIMIIKFWMRKCIDGGTKLETGTICYLVLFYFQKRFKVNAICDSINYNGKWIFGWPVEVTELKGLDSSLLKDVSLMELLKCFFEFYSNFDFKSCAICPFVGKEIFKVQMSCRLGLPREYHLLRDDLSQGPNPKNAVDDELFLQDPLFHLDNLTIDIDAEIMKNIKKAFGLASQIFEKNDANVFYLLFSSKSD